MPTDSSEAKSDDDSGLGTLRVVRSFRNLINVPLELVIVGYVGVTLLLVQNGTFVPTAVRTVVGLGLVLFLPGYGVLSMFFPARGKQTDQYMVRGRGLGWPERVALSFAISLVILPILGVLFPIIGLGFNRTTITSVVAIFVLVATFIGGARRLRLSEEERHVVPFTEWVDEFRMSVRRSSLLDNLLNLVLVLLVVGAVVALTYAFVVPPGAQPYSEFYLLSEDNQGDLVTSNYPENLVQGTGYQFYVGINNHEGRVTNYTVVGELQRVQTEGSDVAVRDRERVAQFRITLEPGETAREGRTVTPHLDGQNLRLVYYLFKGKVPASPSSESAYRTTYVWVDVRAQ
jgi:uncharacterized membrane protein